MTTKATKYAKVNWQAEDVLVKRENWTIEQAESWLGKNEQYLQDAMVSAGWEAMEVLLDEDD